MTSAQAPRSGRGDAVEGGDPLDLVGFVRANPRAVLTTVAADGSPQAALLDVAVTDDGELVLDSRADARKVTNLRAEPRVALVVGVGDVTLQVEGTAVVLEGADRERCGAVYERRFPGARALADGFAVVLVTPRWTRLYDARATPATTREAILDRDSGPRQGEKICVRIMRETDLAALTRARRSWAQTCPAVLARQEAGSGRALVAFAADVPVGIGEVVLDASPPILRNLSVLSDWRGRGVGTRIVQLAEAIAAPYGALRLAVGVDNPDARRLYVRLGYTSTCESSTTTYEYVDDVGVTRTATETDDWFAKELAP